MNSVSFAKNISYRTTLGSSLNIFKCFHCLFDIVRNVRIEKVGTVHWYINILVNNHTLYIHKEDLHLPMKLFTVLELGYINQRFITGRYSSFDNDNFYISPYQRGSAQKSLVADFLYIAKNPFWYLYVTVIRFKKKRLCMHGMFLNSKKLIRHWTICLRWFSSAFKKITKIPKNNFAWSCCACRKPFYLPNIHVQYDQTWRNRSW